MDAVHPFPPLVSVVVATYRCDAYLRLALQSILAQTCGNFEVLVADDGGEEATRSVVEGFHDSRLVYHRNPARLGAAGNHWAAIRRARGEFVAILNHDDLWKPDFLRCILPGLDDERVLVSFCDHDVIDPEGRVLPEDTAALSQLTRRAALAAGLHRPFSNLAAVCTVPFAQAAVFRKSALELSALPPEAGPAYDLWLNYLLARTGGGAFYLPERLASWRTHPGSISMNRSRSDWPAGAGACFARMAADPLFAPCRSEVQRKAADCYAAAALADLRGQKRRSARRWSLRALRVRWYDLRACAALLLTLLPRPVLTWLLD